MEIYPETIESILNDKKAFKLIINDIQQNPNIITKPITIKTENTIKIEIKKETVIQKQHQEINDIEYEFMTMSWNVDDILCWNKCDNMYLVKWGNKIFEEKKYFELQFIINEFNHKYPNQSKITSFHLYGRKYYKIAYKPSWEPMKIVKKLVDLDNDWSFNK